MTLAFSMLLLLALGFAAGYLVGKNPPPPLKRCPHCASFYCGPVRCRFTMQPIKADAVVFVAALAGPFLVLMAGG